MRIIINDKYKIKSLAQVPMAKDFVGLCKSLFPVGKTIDNFKFTTQRVAEDQSWYYAVVPKKDEAETYWHSKYGETIPYATINSQPFATDPYFWDKRAQPKTFEVFGVPILYTPVSSSRGCFGLQCGRCTGCGSIILPKIFEEYYAINFSKYYKEFGIGTKEGLLHLFPYHSGAHEAVNAKGGTSSIRLGNEGFSIDVSPKEWPIMLEKIAKIGMGEFFVKVLDRAFESMNYPLDKKSKTAVKLFKQIFGGMEAWDSLNAHIGNPISTEVLAAELAKGNKMFAAKKSFIENNFHPFRSLDLDFLGIKDGQPPIYEGDPFIEDDDYLID